MSRHDHFENDGASHVECLTANGSRGGKGERILCKAISTKRGSANRSGETVMQLDV